MPYSVVNVSAASSIAFPVPTVYFARAGALELSGRILSGEPRSETSQERVGCGLPRDPPSTTACPALPRAGDDPVFLVGEALSAQGSSKKAGSRRFWPKKAYYPRGPGVQPGKLTFILFLVPTRFLFHARFRFERRNPRLERRCLDPFVTGVPP